VNLLKNQSYRGRLAPSPTGLLHLGHARTFWVAQERARANGGMLILRNEDIDSTRFKLEFVPQMIEDLRWFGFEWQEGPNQRRSSIICGTNSSLKRVESMSSLRK